MSKLLMTQCLRVNGCHVDRVVDASVFFVSYVTGGGVVGCCLFIDYVVRMVCFCVVVALWG